MKNDKEIKNIIIDATEIKSARQRSYIFSGFGILLIIFSLLALARNYIGGSRTSGTTILICLVGGLLLLVFDKT